MKNSIISYLDELIPDPKCPLNYNRDYELLIAVVLSAQTKDDTVNKVTSQLFSKYDIYSLAKSSPEDIVDILRPLGNMNKKSNYIITICNRLINDQNSTVPNSRDYLESLPGVGRKTANVILATLFNEAAFAVDTHIERVSKRLGIAPMYASVLEVEKYLMDFFEKDTWAKRHLQLLLFGRYTCKSQNPECDNCPLKKYCTYK